MFKIESVLYQVMDDQQTNRDFISDRLNARINQFMYQPNHPLTNPGPENTVHSVDRLGSFTQKSHNTTMNDYWNSQPRPGHVTLPEIDLRKPVSYTVLGKQPETLPTPTLDTNTSDQINQRYQRFEPMSANRAYPVHGQGYCPIDNKPTATRQSNYDK